MRFNVGDRVRIKDIDWYNRSKDDYGSIYAGNGFCFWKNMVRHCGEIMKITSVKVDPEDSNKGYYFMENSEERWTDEMIEGLVEEEEIEFTEEDKYWCDIMSESDPTTYVLPEGYIFKDENGNVINTNKIVLEKKRKEYPKTYEECCDILQLEHTFELKDLTIDEEKLTYSFIRLKRCRDAYWKIAGEEMELGKPWEPDWAVNNAKYSIYTIKGVLTKATSCYDGAILVFPTAEMRDAFYENFKELINSCKELL